MPPSLVVHNLSLNHRGIGKMRSPRTVHAAGQQCVVLFTEFMYHDIFDWDRFKPQQGNDLITGLDWEVTFIDFNMCDAGVNLERRM